MISLLDKTRNRLLFQKNFQYIETQWHAQQFDDLKILIYDLSRAIPKKFGHLFAVGKFSAQSKSKI